MSSRVTITHDGVVKLRSQPTRWRVERGHMAWWYTISPSGKRRPSRRHALRTYLESLTDEELLA